MARTDSTKVKWRVQVRDSHNKPWKNKGLFEVRWMARIDARYLRGPHMDSRMKYPYRDGYGFGNTRVVRHVRVA